MRISIGNDHAGTELKLAILGWLRSQDIEFINHGSDATESVDYPDFTHPVASDVSAGRARFGIVICGSGNGANMTVNKHQTIRGALCWTPELSALARKHNDANVLSIPARFVAIADALEMVKTFVATNFEGGRHARRIEKIPCS